LGIVGAVAASAVVLATQSAYATGGGSNQGTEGVVFNNVTAGGITFHGTCSYFIGVDGLTIVGQGSAVGPSVLATSVTCTVRQGTFSTSSSSGLTAGTTAATETTGLPPVPGTGVCVSITAFTGITVSSGTFCV